MNQEIVINEVPTSAYLHIPFCRRRCFYCDFPVSVVGDKKRGETSGAISRYVGVLCQEIAITPSFGKPLETIFFGGGTPSLLSASQLQQIIDTLNQYFGISPSAEISMEIDPGTFDLQHLQSYHEIGVNRVSCGVQAFQETLLQLSGRSHNLTDTYSAIELIRQVNISNFSLDLISGLPNQTLEMWQQSLEEAISLTPNHISIYDLTIEPGTAFGRYFQPGDKPLPTDETTVQMYRMAQHVLTHAGYEHYEISNYAQPGYQCRHNRVYWENRPYYAFGMGAASYIQGKRFTRPRQTQTYYDWVTAGAVINCEVTPPNEVFLDTLMVGLRLAEGLDLAKLQDKFGIDKVAETLKILQPYIQKDWVIVKDQNLSFSDPEGFLFSNVILSQLFAYL
jgi:putative oxygen-independent coproporphyrinogen III oxidase